MDADDYTANDALPPGFTVEGSNGPAVVRAFWEKATNVLGELQREADSHRNLYPEDDQ